MASSHGSSVLSAASGVRRAKRGVTNLLAMLGVLALGLAVGAGVMWAVTPKPQPIAVVSASKNEQVVTAMQREQQVVLLSLGIQGIATKEQHSKLFGADIPGSGRQVYMQYSYRAKLGLEGRDVKIQQTGDKTYKVQIPDFSFIGHENEEFKTIVDKNGVLSGVTPQIDKVKLINEILNDDTKRGQVNANRTWLEEQTRNYYDGLVHAIDRDIKLDYEFKRP